MADESRHESVEELHAPRDEDEFDEVVADAIEVEAEDFEERGRELMRDRRRIAGLLAAVVLLVVAIYVILPKVVGLNDVFGRLSDATWYWVVIAAAFNALSFGAYTVLFRGVVAGREDDLVHRRLDLKTSYQITIARLPGHTPLRTRGADRTSLKYWAR